MKKKNFTNPFMKKKHVKKTPFEIIEDKYGKGPSSTSTQEVTTYLNKKGHKSLSLLIEAK